MKEFLHRKNGLLKKRSVFSAFILTSVMALMEYENSRRINKLQVVSKYDFIFFSKIQGDLATGTVGLQIYDFLLFFFLALFIAGSLGYAIDLDEPKYFNNNIKNLSIIVYFLCIPFGIIITFGTLITTSLLSNASIILNSFLSILGIESYFSASGIIIPLALILTFIPFYFFYLPSIIYRRKTNNKRQTKDKKEDRSDNSSKDSFNRENQSKEEKSDKKENKKPSHLQKTTLWLILFLVITAPIGIVVGEDIVKSEEEVNKIHGVSLTEDNCSINIFSMGEANKIIVGDKTVESKTKVIGDNVRFRRGQVPKDSKMKVSSGDKIIIQNGIVKTKIKPKHISDYNESRIDFEKGVIKNC